MGPIERVRARAEAYALLGVTHGSEPEEIRAAWRRVAFEMHPDRHGGDQSGFVRARAAYDFLCRDEAYAFSTSAVSREAVQAQRNCAAMGRLRPSVTSRVTALRPDILDACHSLLSDEENGAAAAHLRVHPDAPVDCADPSADHVPGAIERQGRALTYLIASALAPGLNRVALPTAILECTRRQKPQILAVSALEEQAGDVKVPRPTLARLFPNARSVRLRFGARLAVEAVA